MTHKKIVLLAAFVALFGAVALTSPTFARRGADDTVTETEHTETETHTESEVETEHDESLDDNTKFLSPTQKERVKTRETELTQRIETIKANRAQKLADKRLEVCQKRQAQINQIFANATERSQKQLAVFQAIEEKVKAFYVAKNLTSDGYETAAKNADAKEAAAVAAIGASETVAFDCGTADATKPGSAIKEAMNVRHTALKEYRTAVKDLILAVKQHNGQNRGDAADTDTDTTTTQTQAPTRQGDQ